MALSKAEQRKAIKAELRMGAKPKELAEKYEVSVATVYAIRKEIDAEIEDESINQLKDIPTEVIHQVVEESKTKAPQLTNVLTAIEVGADGLKKLDAKFQETTAKALARFDEYLLDPETPLKDIKLIIDTTANAYEKVFNSGTNIHIGDNNNVSNQKLTIFKNKMGV